MKTLIALLFFAVCTLAVVWYRQAAMISSLQKELAVLAAIPKPKTYPLEFQERCADQARKAFKELGYKPNDVVAYTSHFNSTLKKCFMHLEYLDNNAISHRNVADATEGRVYAQYMFKADKVKKYWDVAPVICQVTLGNGEERYCKTTEEFNELIR